MAPRKKPAEQLGLGEAPVRKPAVVPAAGELPPAIVEYQNGTEAWTCKRFDLLAAELPGVTVGALPRLQLALEMHSRQWLIARRLFGIMPVVASPAVAIEDLQVWSPQQLVNTLGLKPDQWQQELAAVRGIWNMVAANLPSAPVSDLPPLPPRGLFSDDELVKKYDFGRIRFRDQAETERFVERLREFEKLLQDKTTTGVARNLLNTELQLGRIDEEISSREILGDDYRKNLKLRSELMADYNRLISLLDKLAPWFGTVAGYSFKGTIAEVTRAIQEYQADANHALADGIFTHTEIQVELRRSVQTPEPRYRLGWVVAALEAKANLWDRHFKSAIPHSVFKSLDHGMREAIKAAGQETGEPLVDLEKDGPGGEYPDIITVPAAITDTKEPDLK